MGLIFCEPSLFSLTFVVFGSLILLFLANSSLFIKGGFISNLVLGKNSPGLVESARQTTLAFSDLTLGNPTLNNILFFGFWMMLGLIIYVTFSTIGQILSETGKDIETLNNAQNRMNQLEETFWLRFATRSASFLGLIFYSIAFFKMIFPFSILASRAWLGSLNQISGWFYGALGFIVLALSLHVLVIILRFLLLRPRLLGGWNSFV